jgi:S-adenosylmethionine hydrolase
MFTDLQLITLMSDFGFSHYVGEMKGVVKKVNPKAETIDVTHSITRHNILEGAFILSRIWRHFPKNTVHVVVVDPGVGSDRRALAVETDYCMLVGPDNGILRWALKDQEVVRAVALDAGEVQERAGLEGLSPTFHGRDVFAPAAALISKGVDVDTLGARVEDIEKLDIREDVIVHIDGFGNIVTTVAKEIPPGTNVVVSHAGMRHEANAVKTFSDAGSGQLIVLVGSHGLLEVDVARGNAADALAASTGDDIRIENAG